MIGTYHIETAEYRHVTAVSDFHFPDICLMYECFHVSIASDERMVIEKAMPKQVLDKYAPIQSISRETCRGSFLSWPSLP